MRAAGAVNVVIAAVETGRGRLNPALELEGEFCFRASRDRHFPPQPAILRAARILDRERSRRQQNDVAVTAVNLRLEIEVGRKPFRLRRMHMAGDVAENEARGRRRTIVVAHAEFHGHGGPDVEQHWYLRAKARVLCPAAHVERDRGLTFPSVAAVKDGQRVFHFETAQMRRHRRSCEHLQIEELIRVGRLHLRLAQRLALHSLRAERCHARIDLPGLRTGYAKLLRDRAEVHDFDYDRRVSALLQQGLRRTASHLDARLRVQFHDEQRLFIEQLLQALGLRLSRRFGE